jgi:hypothetical protein
VPAERSPVFFAVLMSQDFKFVNNFEGGKKKTENAGAFNVRFLVLRDALKIFRFAVTFTIDGNRYSVNFEV